MRCADFPRHLGRQITRCLIAHPDGADTIELAHWAGAGFTPSSPRPTDLATKRVPERMIEKRWTSAKSR